MIKQHSYYYHYDYYYHYEFNISFTIAEDFYF